MHQEAASLSTYDSSITVNDDDDTGSRRESALDDLVKEELPLPSEWTQHHDVASGEPYVQLV